MRITIDVDASEEAMQNALLKCLTDKERASLAKEEIDAVNASALMTAVVSWVGLYSSQGEEYALKLGQDEHHDIAPGVSINVRCESR